jgi:hypothetical protein
MLEGTGGPGEVNPGQVGMRQRHPRQRVAVPGHQVDHSRRQARRLEQSHDEVRGELLGRRRLPYDGVAHQRGSGRQVAGDRGEVERRDRQDEAFQRAMVEAVPYARPGDRLLGKDLPGEMNIEPPEVDQLAGRVDLGLDRRFGLPEDGGAVQCRPPRPGKEIGGLQEDSGAVIERQRPPGGRCLARSVNGRADVVLRRVAESAKYGMPVVWLDNVDLLAAAQPLGAADRHRELHPFRGELLDPLLQGEPLLASRGVRLDRFVDRVRHYGDGVHAGVCSTIVLADGVCHASSHGRGSTNARQPLQVGRRKTASGRRRPARSAAGWLSHD